MSLHPNGSLTAQDDINQLIVEGGAHNKAAREVFAGSDIIMTGSWNATVELYEYHRELADGRGHECGESHHSHLSNLHNLKLPCRGPWLSQMNGNSLHGDQEAMRYSLLPAQRNPSLIEAMHAAVRLSIDIGLHTV